MTTPDTVDLRTPGHTAATTNSIDMNFLPAKKPFPFLALPRELRDEIYTYCIFVADANVHGDIPLTLPYVDYEELQDPQHQDHDYKDAVIRHNQQFRTHIPFKRFFDLLPALCKVSHQVYEEATPLWLRAHDSFRASRHTDFEYCARWLDTFPRNSAWSSLRRLQINRKFLRIEKSFPSRVRAFVQKCTQLQTVDISLGWFLFCQAQFVRNRDGGEEACREMLEEFVGELDLVRLLDAVECVGEVVLTVIAAYARPGPRQALRMWFEKLWEAERRECMVADSRDGWMVCTWGPRGG
ncbi:hypothetical protein BDV96DRAFT_650901 [Lophiotrema nucula]|uniref:F-box domain-containing protein n=1 Tax=Lophiotrema nucula TaxID=690887 RepID=A0A6A5YSY7_9PLEO|nr:hypothetical protein BDV96DRAFT_650901 [Lophiotrema nucula]